jgi:hypothetical protein
MAYILFTTLIPLSGVGTTCVSSCCDKDSAFIITTGRVTSTLLESNDLQPGPTA